MAVVINSMDISELEAIAMFNHFATLHNSVFFFFWGEIDFPRASQRLQQHAKQFTHLRCTFFVSSYKLYLKNHAFYILRFGEGRVHIIEKKQKLNPLNERTLFMNIYPGLLSHYWFFDFVCNLNSKHQLLLRKIIPGTDFARVYALFFRVAYEILFNNCICVVIEIAKVVNLLETFFPHHACSNGDTLYHCFA